MQAKPIEPGLLQVFRGYAGLRILLALFTFLSLRAFFVNDANFTSPFIPNAPSGAQIITIQFNSVLYGAIVIGEMILLWLYLSLPWFKQRLKGTFLPLGLALATTGLILELYIASPSTRYLQPEPFMYLLLILIAWQYDMRSVLVFAIGVFGLETLLFITVPTDVVFIPRSSSGAAAPFFIGRMLSRSVSFVLLGFVITRLMRGQRQQRQALAEANVKLTQYAATQEHLAVSRERNRISRELHDTLAHTLSALTVQLDAVTTVWNDIPNKARQMLDQMLGTTRSGLDETRRALQDLRASPLEDMGLASALRSLAEDVAKRNALQLETDINDAIDELSPEVEQSIYRIAQETLENVSRHANARQVKVQLQQQNSIVSLSISDDGRGFDPDDAEHENKFGLQGVRERAEVIGAELEIESRTDEGTHLKLNWKRPQ